MTIFTVNLPSLATFAFNLNPGSMTIFLLFNIDQNFILYFLIGLLRPYMFAYVRWNAYMVIKMDFLYLFILHHRYHVVGYTFVLNYHFRALFILVLDSNLIGTPIANFLITLSLIYLFPLRQVLIQPTL